MESSIVIPAYNSQSTITLLIEICLNQSVKSEIIIVDDGSTDGTGEIVKKYPVKYIYQENLGPAKARNTGWKNAKGEIILFTDSDCIPEKDWIEKHIRHYANPKVAGVGGSYDIANSNSLLARCIHEEIIQRHLWISEDTDYLGSFNLSYRRKVLEKLNGFNEFFKQASGEDNELSYRAKKAGYKLIFDKDIKVAHYHQTNLFKYLQEQYHHGFWRAKLYKIYPDMVKGDNYAGILDFIQPPLAAAILGTIIISLFYSPLFYVSFLWIIFLLVLQFPLTLVVIKRKKQFVYLYLIPILFLRAFARGFGMLKGIWDFFVLEAIKK